MFRRNIEIEVEIDDFSPEEIEDFLTTLLPTKLSSTTVVILINLLLKQGEINEILNLLFIAKDIAEFEMHPINPKFGVEFKFQLDQWKFVNAREKK